MSERIVTSKLVNEDIVTEYAMRPKTIEKFVGQKQIISNLKIFLQAAKSRNEALDHVLLSGPPGLGKTTIAQIIANEMGTNIKITSGPVLAKTGDLAAILTNLHPKDILFIDEIHRMQAAVEEMLYPAMEDFKIDIMIGEGQAARSLRLDLPQFTVVAATTRLGLLSQPLRERFGIPLRFEFYSIDELANIITHNSNTFNLNIENEAAQELARRSRGTPRIALRLLRRVRDFVSVQNTNVITTKIVNDALNKLNVDLLGLDSDDKKYLNIIKNVFNNGPVGIETIAAALCESANTIEEVIEPYLLQLGLVQKTPRGRTLTDRGLKSIDK